jgi:hypothetical protein
MLACVLAFLHLVSFLGRGRKSLSRPQIFVQLFFVHQDPFWYQTINKKILYIVSKKGPIAMLHQFSKYMQVKKGEKDSCEQILS